MVRLAGVVHLRQGLDRPAPPPWPYQRAARFATRASIEETPESAASTRSPIHESAESIPRETPKELLAAVLRVL